MLEKIHIGFLKRHKVQTDHFAKNLENWNDIIEKRQEELDEEKISRYFMSLHLLTSIYIYF